MRLSRPLFARTLAAASLAAALSCTTLPVFAHNGEDHSANPVAAEQARQQAADHTQALVALQKRWEKAQGAEKSRVRDQMVAKAEERRAFLLELMESNPAEVLRVAIPEEKQLGMPAEVIEKLEQKLELEGKLDIIHVDDFEDPEKSRLRRYLTTPFGERFDVHFAGNDVANALSGANVRLNGLLLNDGSESGAIAVNTSDSEAVLMLAAGGTNTTSGGAVSPVANTFGEQKVAVILVNFQDDPNNKPATTAQTHDIVFGEVNQFMLENSYQQTWLAGDTFGWFTIAQDSTTCDPQALEIEAIDAATANGADLSQYDRLVYIHPYTTACKWGGLGTVGGSPSKAFINGKFQMSTIAHELGHNLGLYHSKALECGDSTLGTNCSSIEYGDIPDVMGTMVAGHFSAPQKERLGWLGYGSSPAITTVEGSGSFPLSPYSAQNNGPKALKFLKGVDPSTGHKVWYYVEYRQAVGFDSGLTIAGNFLKGATVHTAAPENGDSFHILDMTGQTSDWWDAALEVGQRFDDFDSSTTIATQWADSQGATVYVEAGAAQTCLRTNPSFSLSPADTQWAAAGIAISYSITLTNNDTSACGASSFALSASIPSGWNSSLNGTSVTLQPGVSNTIPFTVTSASNATETFYGLDFSASSGEYGASKYVYVVIDNSLGGGGSSSNSAPTASNDNANTEYETPVTIYVLANDSDPDGDTLTITSVSGVNGNAVINANGSITFTPATGFSGTEAFNYSISDGNGHSATASVSVNVADAPVSNTNRAPVAQNDAASTASNSAITIAVLDNDSDPDGDALKVIAVAEGGKGSVLINSDGTVTFTPAKSFKSSDTFSYTITDGKLTSTGNVTVTLNDGGTGGGTGKGNGRNK